MLPKSGSRFVEFLITSDEPELEEKGLFNGTSSLLEVIIFSFGE